MDTSKKLQPWDINEASEADLASMNTRHLKALLAEWRNVPDHDRYYEPDPDGVSYVKACERLRAVLATRPHVPNKNEAKLLRQQAAKRKR